MSLTVRFSWLPKMRRPLLEWVLSAVVIVAMTAAGVLIFTVVRNTFFDDPPIVVSSLDPQNLGVFCGGESVPVHNRVAINASIIVIYYLSTINPATGANLIGTQSAFTDMQYPEPVAFEQTLPWRVPFLPPGQYVRSFAARNIEGAQKTVFVKRQFEIGEC